MIKKKRFLWIVYAAAALYLYQKRQVLLAIASVLIYACALTLILAPMCKRIEQKGIKPSLAALISLALVLLTAGTVLAVFVPYLGTHTAALVRRSVPAARTVAATLSSAINQFGIKFFSLESLSALIAESASVLTAFLARTSVSVAAQTGRFLFSLVIAYYLLRERRGIGCHILLFVPLHRRTAFLCTLRSSKNAVLGYFSGLIKTSAFISLGTYIGLVILGIPDSLLLSLFMGIFEVLPYIGPVLACIPILLSAIPLGMKTTVLAFCLVLLVQQIESNIIGPYFTASSTSISPLIAVLSVFVLGSLFGVWGILLAIPVMVTIQSILWSYPRTTC